VCAPIENIGKSSTAVKVSILTTDFLDMGTIFAEATVLGIIFAEATVSNFKICAKKVPFLADISKNNTSPAQA
jgi:hypothetical protein